MAAITGLGLQKGLAQRRRVVWALTLREMRSRFGHSRIGYGWALGEPIVFIAGLSAIKAAAGFHAAPLGSNMQVFFFTGIVPFLLFRRLGLSLTSAIAANRALLKYPPVRPLDTLVARTLLETATVLVSAVAVAVGFHLFGLPIIPPDPLGFLVALAITGLLGVGYGVLSAAILGVFETWSTISGWLMRLTFFASGVFFVVDFLGPETRARLAWNPIAQAISLGREAYYPGFVSEIVDMPYMLSWGFGLLTAGLLAERALRRRSEE